MSFDDDFQDIFDAFDIIKKSKSDFERMLSKIEKGEIQGTWEIREIDEPSCKGYAIQGRFATRNPAQPIDPIDPLRPAKRRPLPEKPFEIPRKAMEETREPLVDIFQEDNEVRIYVELPGVDAEDIELDFRENCIDVTARNFRKKIDLPVNTTNWRSASKEYRNGLLIITIPKEKQLRNEDLRKLKAI